MFKEFIQRIIEAKNHYDAVHNVFYGMKWDDDGNIEQYGIDIAYQQGKIDWDEYQMLIALIDKMK